MHPRREHALHNEAACRYLESHGTLGDWVITTAFYSALHWVRYHIFPLTINTGATFRDIGDYCGWQRRMLGYKISQHQALLKTVQLNCKPIHAAYRRLHDECMTARYQRYQSRSIIVQSAIADMERIRSYCDKPKAP